MPLFVAGGCLEEDDGEVECCFDDFDECLEEVDSICDDDFIDDCEADCESIANNRKRRVCIEECHECFEEEEARLCSPCDDMIL